MVEIPVEEKIKQILKENKGFKDKPKLTDTLEDDLGMDSLDMVEFVMHLEEEFNINLDEFFIDSGWVDVKDVVACVKELING